MGSEWYAWNLQRCSGGERSLEREKEMESEDLSKQEVKQRFCAGAGRAAAVTSEMFMSLALYAHAQPHSFPPDPSLKVVSPSWRKWMVTRDMASIISGGGEF